MSETRAAYNVALQPGRELDALVARVMGRLSDQGLAELKQRGAGVPEQIDEWGRYILDYSPWENVLRYSTDPAHAMEAWAWLEENNPWDGGLVLYRSSDGEPTVSKQFFNEGKYYNVFIQGTTYPHAISLAIIAAGKVLGVID